MLNILTLQKFYEDQPDLQTSNIPAVFVTSCINSANRKLRAYTNGLYSEVVEYNYIDRDGVIPNPDRLTTNRLYRSDTELQFVFDAVIECSKLIINLGNDNSDDTSQSFGGYGVSYSETKQQKFVMTDDLRDLLTKARLIKDFSFGAKEGGIEDCDPKSYIADCNDYCLGKREAELTYAHSHYGLSGANKTLKTNANGDVVLGDDEGEPTNILSNTLAVSGTGYTKEVELKQPTIDAIAKATHIITDGLGTKALMDNGNYATIPNQQIQADWNQTDASALDYIKNKPTIPQAPVQADYNQTVTTVLDYIKNKPTNLAHTTGDETISGDKTFDGITIFNNELGVNGDILVKTGCSVSVPDAPISDDQLTNKKYVDEQIASGISPAGIMENTEDSATVTRQINQETGLVNFTAIGSAPTNMVTTDTNQEITGVKTFTTTPIISNAPVNDTDAVNKKYADSVASLQENIKLNDQVVDGVEWAFAHKIEILTNIVANRYAPSNTMVLHFNGDTDGTGNCIKCIMDASNMYVSQFVLQDVSAPTPTTTILWDSTNPSVYNSGSFYSTGVSYKLTSITGVGDFGGFFDCYGIKGGTYDFANAYTDIQNNNTAITQLQDKTDMLTKTGDGTKYLADDGTYKPISVSTINTLNGDITLDAKGQSLDNNPIGIDTDAPTKIISIGFDVNKIIDGTSIKQDNTTGLIGSEPTAITSSTLTIDGTDFSKSVDLSSDTQEQLTKADKIVITGDGSKYLADDGTYKTIAIPTNTVTTDTDQTISGTKTFTTAVVLTATPTNPTDATNKSYVDNAVGNVNVGVKTFNGATGDILADGSSLMYDSVAQTSINTQIDNNNNLALHLAGVETITGAKTIGDGALLKTNGTGRIQTEFTPAIDVDVTNKQYVDNAISQLLPPAPIDLNGTDNCIAKIGTCAYKSHVDFIFELNTTTFESDVNDAGVVKLSVVNCSDTNSEIAYTYESIGLDFPVYFVRNTDDNTLDIWVNYTATTTTNNRYKNYTWKENFDGAFTPVKTIVQDVLPDEALPFLDTTSSFDGNKLNIYPSEPEIIRILKALANGNCLIIKVGPTRSPQIIIEANGTVDLVTLQNWFCSKQDKEDVLYENSQYEIFAKFQTVSLRNKTSTDLTLTDIPEFRWVLTTALDQDFPVTSVNGLLLNVVLTGDNIMVDDDSKTSLNQKIDNLNPSERLIYDSSTVDVNYDNSTLRDWLEGQTNVPTIPAHYRIQIKFTHSNSVVEKRLFAYSIEVDETETGDYNVVHTCPTTFGATGTDYAGLSLNLHFRAGGDGNTFVNKHTDVIQDDNNTISISGGALGFIPIEIRELRIYAIYDLPEPDTNKKKETK